MPGWEPDDALSHPLDFRLVSNSFVSLFFSQAVLNTTTDWLNSHGYDVRSVNASAWTAEADMHRDLAVVLEFPEHYGRNLDALSDCLSDVAAADYGVAAGATGLVLLLSNFDAFASAERECAQSLLDIFATQARAAALIGHRMICLVQSGDPRLRFDPVGATPVPWNDAEWLDSERGL